MEGLVDNEWQEGGKNRWRYQEGSNRSICEIELTQGQVALIDAERLQEILPYKWHARHPRPPYEDTFYATSSHYIGGGRGSKIEKLQMHILLFPDLAAPRDHIDRNGLNNTKANLRSGADGINGRNRRTPKPDIGIHTMLKTREYVAIWRESNGKQMNRHFKWAHYRSKEDAYNAAVKCRQENDKRATLEILTAQKEGQVIERHVKRTRTSNSGEKNLCIQYKKDEPYRVKAALRLDGLTFSKTFSAFQFEGNMDNAMQAARDWLETTKKANGKREREGEDE